MWRTEKVKDACRKIPLTGLKIRQKDYLETGVFPVVDQGQELIGGYFDDKSFLIPEEPPFIVFGDHTRVKKFVNFKFIPGADGIKVLKPDSEYLPKFFYYALHTVKYPDKGYARHFQHVETTEIPLPPMEEQERIVAKIEELFSELDAGVESLKKARAQLKTYRQSVLKHAFEGRLTNDNIKDGELPEGWRRTTLGEISQSRLGKMLDREKNQGTLQPYLRNINVRWSGFELEDVFSMRFESDEDEKFGLIEGDLIVCEGGEPGRCAIWKVPDSKMKIQKALHRVRFKNSETAPFVMYFLKFSADGKALAKYFTGTTIKHLTGESLRQVKLPFPPVAEQKRIVAEIESRLSVCDKMEEAIEAGLKQAEALRQSILKKAFEGKLVPQSE